MNRKTNYSKIILSPRYNWMKLLFNYRFISLLAFALFLQFPNLSATPVKYKISTSSVNSKAPANNHDSPFDLFIEEESSEEDEIKQDHSALSNLKSRLFSYQEIHYTASINTRYLNLVSSILHTTETPLIVLHHSWKSDLV